MVSPLSEVRGLSVYVHPLSLLHFHTKEYAYGQLQSILNAGLGLSEEVQDS